MGKKGQRSVQIGFKVNERLKERIDESVDECGGTLTEFLNDAVKFYLNFLDERKIALSQAAEVGEKTTSSERT